MAQILITLSNEERSYEYEDLGLTYESEDEEIIDAVSGMVLEDVGLNLSREFDNGNWTVKRVDSTQNVYIFPKSTAGFNN